MDKRKLGSEFEHLTGNTCDLTGIFYGNGGEKKKTKLIGGFILFLEEIRLRLDYRKLNFWDMAPQIWSGYLQNPTHKKDVPNNTFILTYK